MNLRKDDTAPSLTVTITRSGTAVDITSGTVTMKVKKKGSSTNKFSRDATITDATNGVCRFDWQSSDWDAVGVYEGEISIVYSGGTIETHQSYIYFNVMEDF